MPAGHPGDTGDRGDQFWLAGVADIVDVVTTGPGAIEAVLVAARVVPDIEIVVATSTVLGVVGYPSDHPVLRVARHRFVDVVDPGARVAAGGEHQSAAIGVTVGENLVESAARIRRANPGQLLHLGGVRQAGNIKYAGAKIVVRAGRSELVRLHEVVAAMALEIRRRQRAG